MDPNMQLFVVKCSKVLLLCRYLPWRPGVLNLASFTWVSHRIGVSLDTKCFHFGAFYVASGILWPEETFLWQQIRPPPHQETSVTHCSQNSTLTRVTKAKMGFKQGKSSFQPWTANASILSKLTQMHQLIQITGTARHKDLLQFFPDFLQ